jgi:hypothetical protein
LYAPLTAIAFEAAASVDALVAQVSVQLRNARCKTRILVEPGSIGGELRRQTPWKARIERRRFDVGGACLHTPALRCIECQLACPSEVAVQGGNIECVESHRLLRNLAACRARGCGYAACGHLRVDRECVRQRAAQRPCAAGTRHDGFTAQRPLQLCPPSVRVDRGVRAV